MSAYLPIVCGILALVFAFILSNGIIKEDAGNERMAEISGYIHEGAMAFLTREYKYLAGFIVVVAIIIVAALDYRTAICFVCGAVFSILAGYFGMNVATKANVRTAQAARSGQSKALKIAFSGGAVMGLSVVGLGIVGLSIFCLLFGDNPNYITGFGLGASSITL